jgi:lyso-ornithine lipid O-acyltransferase
MAELTSDWPPPLPDASGFVAPPVPGTGAAISAFLRASAADPAGALRVAGRSLWLAAIAALCIPAHLLWRQLGQPSPWPKRFLAWAARACGIRVRCIEQPVTHNVFVAQDGIAIWPGLAFICRLNDTIFVNRSDRMGVPAQITAMRQQFNRHSRIAMFPEATCSDGRRLLPFKAPLFAMLFPPPAGARLQPVVIDVDESGRELAWIGHETGAANAWRLLSRSGCWDARVHFLPPFDPAELPDRKALSARARTAIAAKLSETLGGRPVA